MDQTGVNQVIQFFADELKQSGIDIYATILFGSCSTGLSTDQSDIDIAIVSKSFQDYDFSNHFHLIGKQIVKIVQHYHIPIDVIPLTVDEYKNEKSFRMEFIRGEYSLPPKQNPIIKNN